MFTKYEPNEYAGEAHKHKQRIEKIDRLLRELRDIDTFERSREPKVNGQREGLVEAKEALVTSRSHSRNLYHRAVAAEIALEINYQATEIQMLQDAEHCQQVIMWEDKPAGHLFNELEYHGYIEVVDEEYREDNVIYTMECDFDAYYYDKLS